MKSWMHFPTAITNWWVFVWLIPVHAEYLNNAVYIHNLFNFSLVQLSFEICLIFIGITSIIWNVIVRLLPLCFKENTTLEEAALCICPINFGIIVRYKTENAIRMQHWVMCAYLFWWDDKAWLNVKWEVKIHSLEEGIVLMLFPEWVHLETASEM